ncbi:MAG: biotin--[acetyl-CoA-carboxylase] ligase, partial [Candidatus Omnitrophica bacterium]|nr:biotin--[acetyl-CoA-carboxylase] ligase [Candidatus Omnitrophota bacterium]
MKTIKVEILKRLLASREYISGENLSRGLSVSRAYVWKTIKELETDGFVIEGVSNKGYKLLRCPDKLYGYYIAAKLVTSFIGMETIEYHQELDSTNNRAYRMAEEGANQGLLVISEYQTKGKGRAGREWMSPSGVGLYFSLVLKPQLHIEKIPSVTLVAALSIVETIKDELGLEFQIKWPNDILFRGKKICGILSEIKAEPDKIDFIVLGIGININTAKKDLPEKADSLKEILGNNVDRV